MHSDMELVSSFHQAIRKSDVELLFGTSMNGCNFTVDVCDALLQCRDLLCHGRCAQITEALAQGVALCAEFVYLRALLGGRQAHPGADVVGRHACEDSMVFADIYSPIYKPFVSKVVQ